MLNHESEKENQMDINIHLADKIKSTNIQSTNIQLNVDTPDRRFINWVEVRYSSFDLTIFTKTPEQAEKLAEAFEFMREIPNAT